MFFQASMGSNSGTIDMDEEGDEMNNVFDQISQAQSSLSSQRQVVSTPPVPQSNVGNRRHRRDNAKGGKKLAAAVEPGFGIQANEPVNITKKKSLILGGLKDILANHRKALPAKKDAFDLNPLESLDQVIDLLALNDNGELVKMSSMLYAMRVDTTYTDAVATNVQLQPHLAKVDDGTKKSKADQKFQQSTATQSINLQKLQHEMDQDAPEDEQLEDAFPGMDEPDAMSNAPIMMDEEQPMENGQDGGEGGGMEEMGGMNEGGDDNDMGGDIGGGGMEGGEGGVDDEEGEEGRLEGMMTQQPQEEQEDSDVDDGKWMLESDDEEQDKRRKDIEWKDEQVMKVKDKDPIDTARMKYSDKVIDEYVEAEIARRNRNLNRKCDMNPMLMDGEKQARIQPSDILTNEYYQIATSHYKELNASGMLSYNAKVTHNGRMTLMHKTMDTWKDEYANDHTRPTIEFRVAVAGLIEDAMSAYPRGLNLFDPKDIPKEKNLLTTGLQLQELEKKTRDKILTDTGDFDFLDKDDEVESDDEDEPPRPPSRKGSLNGDDGRPGPSSIYSIDPSTPSAETENSGASPKTTTKNKDDEMDRESQSQKENEVFMEDIAGMDTKKARGRNGGLLLTLQSEDTIKNGPVLSVDDLASKFQQILFNKVAMGSKVEWKTGSHCEELEATNELIEKESFHLRNWCTVTDMMHLDKLWTSKYYKRRFTAEEVKQIKDNMFQHMGTTEHEKMSIHFKPGEYEFLGHDDKWTNPLIMVDEFSGQDDSLVRDLEDEREKKHFNIVIAREEGEDIDEDESDDVPVDERICVQPEPPSVYDDHNDDMGDNDHGLMSDDEAPTSSSRDKRSDYTAGDDQREGEASELTGEIAPTIPDNQPSEAVRATGKVDDSHWMGGNAEVVMAKKEKKKKLKDDDEHRMAAFFDCTDVDALLDTTMKKCAKRFAQTSKNYDLMKETDQLLMPVQVDIVPQLDYKLQSFYSPFLLPDVIHSNYVLREDDAGDGTNARLEHYSNLLDSSMNEGSEGDDVFLSFLRTFKNFPEVSTQKEIELEKLVQSGEMRPDEAAAEMSTHVDADMGGMGGFDDNDDFGMGGDDEGMDYDGERNDGVASQEGLFVHNQEARELSQARSVADASSHGYGMKVGVTADGKDDEGDAVATMGDREYELRLIKLDTVAMKTALSDVLTNPLMVAEKLDVTLGHFNRAFPTQKLEQHMKKNELKQMETIGEDEELEVELSVMPDQSRRDDSQYDSMDVEATILEIPDAMNVTRALFAPPKEKTKAKTMAFGEQEGASTSQQANQSTEHIELNGHHTLKSTFTCLPARMPLSATSDVTVASTIAMILHLANENNLILNQDGQDIDGVDEQGNTTSTSGNWMTDFEVRLDGDDATGTKMKKVAARISRGVEVLTQLSADEDASDAEKRQKQTEKVLAEMAAKQRAEAEEEKRREREEERKRIKIEQQKKKADEERKKRLNGTANGGPSRKNDKAGSSSAVFELSSDATDDDDIQEVSTVKGNGIKKPDTPSSSRRGTHRSAEDDNESVPGPSTKRPRRSSGANTTVNLEDTIVLDD
ncbi:dpy-26 [Pristionchus pacificus]|uniref:Uncharacterized protein n=1 Tax=Pristionchus pacificus TaxID=54126 RepID=A0A2A6C377_PRIPA|nr:dpy-26 [Pristionchus pacificus]|eukprot:PDM72586.1 hypothetical protein PRIPAC_39020 [Pristionchus pacificus]